MSENEQSRWIERALPLLAYMATNRDGALRGEIARELYRQARPGVDIEVEARTLEAAR